VTTELLRVRGRSCPGRDRDGRPVEPPFPFGAAGFARSFPGRFPRPAFLDPVSGDLAGFPSAIYFFFFFAAFLAFLFFAVGLVPVRRSLVLLDGRVLCFF